jgi:chromosome segregation ATPase
MKNLIGVIILAVVCIVLGVTLFTTSNKAKEVKKIDDEKISNYSNQVVETSGRLEEQRQVNVLLTNDVVARKTEILALTNKYTELAATHAQTEATLENTRAEMAKAEAKINELEAENSKLDQKALSLSNDITNLTARIEDTQRKLAASEGDKAFLEKELKRLMTEKAELERQFNDLDVLRKQVAKLKEELSIARRLEWIRKGLFAASEQKGAQGLLMKGPGAVPAARTDTSNHFDLNVEVNADGTVRVIPPLTNNPAAPTPPK